MAPAVREHPGARPKEVTSLSEYRIPPAGDPFAGTPKHGDQDHPHACNDGWVSIGQIGVDPETGEEVEEFALYLCRRCAEEGAGMH